MAKKLSGRALAERLIPNRLHKTQFDADCNLNIRYPFDDDDQMTLSFNEIVEMLEQAHHLGHHDFFQHQPSNIYQQPGNAHNQSSSLLSQRLSANQQHRRTAIANWKVRMAKLIKKAS